MKSINYVSLTARASNNSRDDTIRLGAVYVCDDEHDEIIEKIFSREK